MAVISDAQRKEEIRARLDMLSNKETLNEEEKAELLKQLSIRDRLMRRATHSKVETKLKDDLGEYTIYTRLMKSGERDKFLKLNKMLSEAGPPNNDPEKYNEAMSGMKELVAVLNVTPGLGVDYWMSEDTTDDVVFSVILNTFNGAAQAALEGVTSFRPK